MVEVLEFIFESGWNFLGVCVLILLMTQWQPIDITIINEKKRRVGGKGQQGDERNEAS